MAANIFVDPVIVAIPTDETDRDGIVAWLENLELWLKEALSAHFTWLHSKTITELLEANGRFPSFSNLRDLLRKHHLEIQPSLALLVRSVNDFFRNEEFDLESKLEGFGYEAESKSDSVVILPEAIPARWPDYIHTSMYSLLVTCCVCKQTAHVFANALRIATLKCLDQAQEITISAIITYTIPELACKPGDAIRQVFPLLFTPDDLYPLIDVLAFWYKGETGVTYIIEQQWKKDWHKSDSVALTFSLGSRFIESVASASLDTNEIILRKIAWLAAAVISDQVRHIESAKLHPLRANIAGDSPQRIRSKDQARAWRLDITKHGAGWRLHYWHIPDADGGTIEFSNVCKESDHTIYE